VRWFFAFILGLLPLQALACGPDAAPPQAAAQGFNCETFRWGTGDTISEIDTGLTYAAPCADPGLSPCGGIKLYYNSNNTGGFAPITGGQVTVDGSGRIITQAVSSGSGDWVVNTCGGPDVGASSVWTVGTFFQHGHYVEFVGEWNAPTTSHQTGFYGYDGYWYHDSGNNKHDACPGPTGCYEQDDPDAFAFEQLLAIHTGGTAFPQQQNPNPFSIQPATVETGTNKWGFLSTPSIARYYAGNNVLMGDINFVSIGNTTDMYNSKQCYGSEATIGFNLTVDSIKVWQAGGAPPPVFSGGRRLRH
jgi:hypothetical protein